MKFQSWQLIPGSWNDPKTGEKIDGSIGLSRAETVEAKTVRDAMRLLRSPFNPSPIVTVVGADAWAHNAVQRLVR